MYTWIPISGPADFGKLAHLFQSFIAEAEIQPSTDSVEALTGVGCSEVDTAPQFESQSDAESGDAGEVHWEAQEYVETTRAYDLETVGQELSMAMTPAVKGLLIELSYVDKDYRSTYYHFYAKKGRRYESNCLRIHLFGEGVTFDEQGLELNGLSFPINAQKGDSAPNEYLGFFTVRPTYRNTIGRSIVAPRASQYARGLVVSSAHKVHVLGYDLSVRGFPWMQQHMDISVCAHVACWAILRHYSERYRKYREYLTYDITRSAYEFDRGGLVPSFGLTIAHAERVFSEAGTYPIVVRRTEDEGSNGAFYRQLLAYLESGFPLFAKVGDDHAAAVVGVEWKKAEDILDSDGSVDAWSMVESLVTIDDNYLPYTRLGRKFQPPQKREAGDIDVFIAPLPDKIYYPAELVDVSSAALPVSFGEMLEFPLEGDRVVRYFVTTAASLRRHMRERPKEFAEGLTEAVMKLSLPQFVWIVEYSSIEEWRKKQVSVCALMDATAGTNDDDPLWAIFDGSNGLVFDRTCAEVKALKLHGGVRYSRMQANLNPVEPE
ncbi:hypothetical protein [Cupriavidus pauculus]|uniref:hypothetical protein n=1 Tax=Cupriavidus pauculus TaxID=82633 RepID=UPI001FD44FFF|nr:hypothetical protein [Cupriavidus pauculus]